jgi:hypothetical protein
MAAPLHTRLPLAALSAVLLWVASPAPAALPDYQLGDIAVEDVVTPVPLVVVNPEATEALRQNVAKQIQFIVRHSPRSAQDAEIVLRNTVALTRKKFQIRIQDGLMGRSPSDSDIGSPAFTQAVAEVAREAPEDFPFDLLAPLWVQGKSDESVIKSLLQPVQEVLGQVIIDNKGEISLPANQTVVRLVPVRNLDNPPSFRDLDRATEILPAGKIISLWRARRLVETSFPAAQQSLGKFAASFVRANAMPDPQATELLRTSRLQGITANDTYSAAQTIVVRGQIIDRKALGALAAMREKSLIGTLQTKLEQQQQKAPAPTPPTSNPLVWIAASLGAVFLLLLGIFWRLRARPVNTLVPVHATPELSSGTALPALPSDSPEALAWQQRALAAEAKASRAHEAIRTGVLGWMKEKIVHTLFRQRTELLAVQQKAEAEMHELEERLEKLHTPLQDRLTAYAKRIEELEKELAVKGETNRHLLGARIIAARQQMNTDRKRFESN